MIRTQQIRIPTENYVVTFDSTHHEAAITLTTGKGYNITASVLSGSTVPDPVLYLYVNYGAHDTYMPIICHVLSSVRMAVYVVCQGNTVDKDFSAIVEVGSSQITVISGVVNVRHLVSYRNYVRYAAIYKAGEDVYFGAPSTSYSSSLFERIEKDGEQWTPLPSSILNLGTLESDTRLDIFKVKNIGNNTMHGWKGNDKLRSVYTYDTVSFSERCFEMCTALQTFVAHKPIETVVASAFRGDGELTTVIIPGLKYIGSSAFSFCSGLTTIDLPESMLSIGADAFYNSGIRNVTIRSQRPPTLAMPRDIGSATLQHIYVPGPAVETYKHDPQWQSLASIIEAIQ